jgi:hypothetical protein
MFIQEFFSSHFVLVTQQAASLLRVLMTETCMFKIMINTRKNQMSRVEATCQPDYVNDPPRHVKGIHTLDLAFGVSK